MTRHALDGQLPFQGATRRRFFSVRFSVDTHRTFAVTTRHLNLAQLTGPVLHGSHFGLCLDSGPEFLDRAFDGAEAN